MTWVWILLVLTTVAMTESVTPIESFYQTEEAVNDMLHDLEIDQATLRMKIGSFATFIKTLEEKSTSEIRDTQVCAEGMVKSVPFSETSWHCVIDGIKEALWENARLQIENIDDIAQSEAKFADLALELVNCYVDLECHAKVMNGAMLLARNSKRPIRDKQNKLTTYTKRMTDAVEQCMKKFEEGIGRIKDKYCGTE